MILYITLHQKNKHGWEEIKTLASDSKEWDKVDQDWINTLFNCSTDCLTVGNTMYTLEHK